MDDVHFSVSFCTSGLVQGCVAIDNTGNVSTGICAAVPLGIGTAKMCAWDKIGTVDTLVDKAVNCIMHPSQCTLK